MSVSSDRRGICLDRVADWNKVNQTDYLRVTLDSKPARQTKARILSTAFGDAVAPDPVLVHGVDRPSNSFESRRLQALDPREAGGAG